MTLDIEPWMRDELERRQQLYRDLFAGRPLERLPIEVRVTVPSPYSVQEQFRDGDKQLESALTNVQATWEHAPSSDTVPAMRPDVGCSCLASAFGTEYYWGEHPDQTPGVRDKIIPLDGIADTVAALPVPDPHRDGWLPEGLRRITRFAGAGDGFIPVSLLDAAGGVNVAADLLGVSELMMAFYDHPEAVHILLDKIQILYAAIIRAGIAAAGGEANITTTDYQDVWYPEGLKGHVSDDISANFGPDIYAAFSAPYHARILKEFGCGGLHNCGPNPCYAAYVAHEYSPRSLDLADNYSYDDLPKFKQSLRGKAFIYLFWDDGRPPVAWYRDIMELMAPDVIVVPVFHLTPENDPEGLCCELRKIATEYAARMNWGWT
ncbi:MAG: uroporphyrinogen decarboxylase family protein [Lentisphaeria bacterium]|nr:uroporphyrinogen decarboxylase family protein [Lentisphaeria bacterium]